MQNLFYGNNRLSLTMASRAIGDRVALPGRNVVIALVSTLMLTFGHAVDAQSLQLRIDGSSTVFPLTDAAAEEFQKARKGGVRISIGISGTGGGFRKFCRGETDVSNASRPILKAELEECAKHGVQFIEMPIAYDALTVVVNPKNPISSITVDELKRMWEPDAEAKILRWNQVNPNFIDRPLRLFGAGRDSGTYDYFTEAVVGSAKSSRKDFVASEDDNVLVRGIANDGDALGFLGYAYYAENRHRLKALSIAWRGGPPVAPSLDSVLKGSYQPLSRPIFIYAASVSLEKAPLREFLDYYNRNAARIVRKVLYVPLPPEAYLYNLGILKNQRFGTKFGGENRIGMTILDLMKMEVTP
ncbi:MAG: PstS family phosphate ABC transporter substrate-binding protein [Burkholderiales bacterium]